MRNDEAIRQAIIDFAPKIKASTVLQRAFLRGRTAIEELQNGRRGKGIDLVISLGGEATRLGQVQELTPHSYAQMLAITREQMDEGEQIHGVYANADDLNALIAQAAGTSWGLLHLEEDSGWPGYQTELFLRKAICGE